MHAGIWLGKLKRCYRQKRLPYCPGVCWIWDRLVLALLIHSTAQPLGNQKRRKQLPTEPAQEVQRPLPGILCPDRPGILSPDRSGILSPDSSGILSPDRPGILCRSMLGPTHSAHTGWEELAAYCGQPHVPD
ncbi:uncharacterized protein LOC121306242 isoform X1 [Polyodon spathula]|uniref:uncharacterized protein LOC121306242 isoform X1 n=1 Tax=Polyodon spathula TaxID=7913 RepID=UPI001B7E5C96|nr:uncharacterized protein LOC121306242 isoform X1 [Polyodon spathula]